MKMHLNILCGVLAIGLAGPVCAATWGLQGTPSSGVAISAVANTDGTSTTDNAAAQKIEAATWMSSYGGVRNADYPGSGRSDIDGTEGSSPEHAIDNNERYDMVLLTFNDMVNLSHVYLSYMSIDSDITVMAFQGTPGSQGLIGKTWSTLDSGWKLIGHYSDAPTNTYLSLSSGAAGGSGSAGVYSSFWLIGAYNPLVGASQGWSLGNDHVKLAYVKGTVCPPGTPACSPPPNGKVPEPGSLALLGLGLLGMMRMRRARQA